MPNARAHPPASIRRPLLKVLHTPVRLRFLMGWAVTLGHRAGHLWSRRVRHAAREPGPHAPDTDRHLDGRLVNPLHGGVQGLGSSPGAVLRRWIALVYARGSWRRQRTPRRGGPPPLTLSQQRARWEQLRESEWLNPLTPRMEVLLEQGAQILTAEELRAVNDELEAELALNRFITLAW